MLLHHRPDSLKSVVQVVHYAFEKVDEGVYMCMGLANVSWVLASMGLTDAGVGYQPYNIYLTS